MRSESFPSIDLGSISIPSILSILTLPGTPGDDRHTKLQPFCSARSLLAAKMALHGFGWEIRQNLNRSKHKKTLKTYKTQLAMMRHYYWCQDVGTHWRGVSRQKKFKSEYVSKHAIIYQSENGWESASWFLDKDSVDTAFLDIHVAQVCDGSLDIGSNTAWSLGIQLSDRVTRVTHNISGCLEHVQRE